MTVIAKGAVVNAFSGMTSLALAVEAVDFPEVSKGLLFLAGMFGVSAIVLAVLILFGKALVNHFTSSLERGFTKLDELPNKAEIESAFEKVREDIHSTSEFLLKEIKAVDSKVGTHSSDIGELKGKVAVLSGRN